MEQDINKFMIDYQTNKANSIHVFDYEEISPVISEDDLPQH